MMAKLVQLFCLFWIYGILISVIYDVEISALAVNVREVQSKYDIDSSNIGRYSAGQKRDFNYKVQELRQRRRLSCRRCPHGCCGNFFKRCC